MTQISFIAVVLISFCVVYGQLPVGNFDHYDPYYFPYTSTFVNQPNGQRDAGTAGQFRGTGDSGNPSNKKNLAQGTVQSRLKQLEANTASLTTQLKETNSKLDQTRSDLFSTQVILADLKSELRITKNDLAMKASQAELDKTNANVLKLSDALAATQVGLANAATQADLDQTNTDVSNLNDALQATITDLETRPTQADLEKINGDILALNNDLQATNDNVATKANQVDLDLVKGDILNLQNDLTKTNDEVATKAALTDLDPIKENVSNLQNDLTKTNDEVAMKAALTDLEPIKDDILTLRGDLDAKASQTQLDSTIEDVNYLKDITSPSTIGTIPASCGDLQNIGYVKSGIYSIMIDKKVNNVYCDFTKSGSADFEKIIGVVDVKSTAIYFNAQMSKSYSTLDNTVPFDVITPNEGNALSATGEFTAPTPGKYYFAYSGIGDESDTVVRVALQTKIGGGDWTAIGEAFGQASFNTFTLHSTLDLLKGDQVRLLLKEGVIFEEGAFYTNFVGWLIEENELPV